MPHLIKESEYHPSGRLSLTPQNFAEITKIASLKYFDVSSNVITSALPSQWAGLQSLNLLKADNNQLTGDPKAIECSSQDQPSQGGSFELCSQLTNSSS